MTPPIHRRRDLSPWSLDRSQWRAVYRRVRDKVRHHHLSLIGAGMAFFGFLSVFPALAALVSIYGLVFEPAHVHEQLRRISSLVPAGSSAVLERRLDELTSTAPEHLSLGVLVGLLTALWSTNKGARGLIEGINLAYGEKESRGYVRLTVLSLGFTVGVMAFAGVLLGLIAVVPAVLRFMGFEPGGWAWLDALRWPAILATYVVGLAVVYSVAPDRKPPRWRWLTPGAVMATALLLAASGIFSLYVGSFGGYSEMYRPVGAVAILLLWGYFASSLVLVGAAVNAEVEEECSRQLPAGDGG